MKLPLHIITYTLPGQLTLAAGGVSEDQIAALQTEGAEIHSVIEQQNLQPEVISMPEGTYEIYAWCRPKAVIHHGREARPMRDWQAYLGLGGSHNRDFQPCKIRGTEWNQRVFLIGSSYGHPMEDFEIALSEPSNSYKSRVLSPLPPKIDEPNGFRDRIIARWKKSIYGGGALSDCAFRLLADMALMALTWRPD